MQGFGAGSVYPQIWLRDSATILPATRYFYSAPFLTSWLEEHLSHQLGDGALWDWIAAGDPAQFTTNAPHAAQVYASGSVVLSADKNTTVADQESSAVDAAWRVYQLTGDRVWLTKSIGGRALVDRLDAALAYVEQQRFDPGVRLVASAFTADWGDVSPTYPDQRAIYLDEATPVVVGLYANAFFARAAEELAELLDAAANPTRAEHWRQLAASVRGAIDVSSGTRPRASTGCIGSWPPAAAPQSTTRTSSRSAATRSRPCTGPRARPARRGSSPRRTRGAAPSASPRRRRC